MSLPLLILMTICWIVAIRCYGAISFVTAGVFCFSVYSLPALLGLVFPFETGFPQLDPAAPAAVTATILAWTVFCFTISIPVGTRRPDIPPPPSAASTTTELTPFLWATVAACVVGYGLIAATQGPLFFLAPREDQADSLVNTLWRWMNSIGLCTALLARSRSTGMIFLVGLVMHFLAGDRTVLVITAFCLLVIYGRGKPIGKLLKPSILIPLLITTVLALVGKPIYLAVKNGSASFLFLAASGDWMENAMATFEPFVTFNILNLVVRHEFSMSVVTVIEGVLGQVLIVPSLFGIDCNSFNTEFTKRHASDLDYGVAGNFWAHGWAVGGPIGVTVFAVIYALALRVFDRGARSCQGIAKVFFSLLGALFAVYAHRNGFDNLLSFVRQLILAMLLLICTARVLTPFFSPSRRSYHQLRCISSAQETS